MSKERTFIDDLNEGILDGRAKALSKHLTPEGREQLMHLALRVAANDMSADVRTEVARAIIGTLPNSKRLSLAYSEIRAVSTALDRAEQRESKEALGL